MFRNYFYVILLELFLISGCYSMESSAKYLPVSPLISACQAGNMEEAIILLENGANPNDCDHQLNTALHFACSNKTTNTTLIRSVVELMLNKDADINRPNKEGLRPLHCLCRGSKTNSFLVEFLLSRGADSSMRTNLGFKPIDLVQEDNPKKAKIRESINKSENGKYLETPLHKACKFNSISTVKTLLESGLYPLDTTNSKNQTPLLVACFSKNITIIQLLLTLNPEINIKDINGLSVLHAAWPKPEIIELLLRHGAIPLCNKRLQTPTQLASWNQPKTVQLLLDFGDDPTVIDIDGNSPFHIACKAINFHKQDRTSTEKDFIEIITLLINFIEKHYGIKKVFEMITAENNEGMTPIMLAQEKWDFTDGSKYICHKKNDVETRFVDLFAHMTVGETNLLKKYYPETWLDMDK